MATKAIAASGSAMSKVGVLLGGAWLVTLAAGPGMAQQQNPLALVQGIVAGAGQSATAPSVDLSERKQLLIVGSTVMKPFTDKVVEHLQDEYEMSPPIVQLKGTVAGMKAFCGGVGAQYPDILAASRGMLKSEFDECIESNVLDVIEVKIGESAVVIATKKGDPVFNMTPRMFYLGLAREIPEKSDFEPNPNASWKQTNKAAPDIPISVIVPPKGAGLRGFFNANFMEGGCRHVKEIDAIFAASERVPKCVTLRKDQHVIEVPEPYTDAAIDALLKAPPGTLAIIRLQTYMRYKDKLDLLPVNNVMPTHDNITEDNYDMVSDLRYYFKRAHMRNNEGRGVVRGIREFMQEITKDEAFGDGGYFEQLGLIALDTEEQAEERKVVRTLKRFAR